MLHLQWSCIELLLLQLYEVIIISQHSLDRLKEFDYFHKLYPGRNLWSQTRHTVGSSGSQDKAKKHNMSHNSRSGWPMTSKIWPKWSVDKLNSYEYPLEGRSSSGQMDHLVVIVVASTQLIFGRDWPFSTLLSADNQLFQPISSDSWWRLNERWESCENLVELSNLNFWLKDLFNPNLVSWFEQIN